MGLVIDTNVFVLAERGGASIDFNRWRSYGDSLHAAAALFHRHVNARQHARANAAAPGLAIGKSQQLTQADMLPKIGYCVRARSN